MISGLLDKHGILELHLAHSKVYEQDIPLYWDSHTQIKFNKQMDMLIDKEYREVIEKRFGEVKALMEDQNQQGKEEARERVNAMFAALVATGSAGVIGAATAGGLAHKLFQETTMLVTRAVSAEAAAKIAEEAAKKALEQAAKTGQDHAVERSLTLLAGGLLTAVSRIS